MAPATAYAYKVRAITTFGSACNTEGACVLVTPSCSGTPGIVVNSLRVARTAAVTTAFTWSALGSGRFNLHETGFATGSTLPLLHLTPPIAFASVTSIVDSGAFPPGLFGVYGSDCAGTSVP